MNSATEMKKKKLQDLRKELRKEQEKTAKVKATDDGLEEYEEAARRTGKNLNNDSRTYALSSIRSAATLSDSP